MRVLQTSLFGGDFPFWHISQDAGVVAPYVQNDLWNVSKTVCPMDPNASPDKNTHPFDKSSLIFFLVGRGAPQGHWLKPRLEQTWFVILFANCR